MSREDWYRNNVWNEDIAEAYFTKLQRARSKDQYLRIQANYLTEKYPEIALELLDKFFELNEPFDLAQAYCDKAAALHNLGNAEEAIESYKQALKFEKNQGTAQTQAYLSLPMLFVEHDTKQHFEFGIELLNEYVGRLMFPIDYFRWHTAMAVFKYGLGDCTEASKQAGLALDAAQVKKSGFRYHQQLGLVGKEYKKTIKVLRAIYA